MERRIRRIAATALGSLALCAGLMTAAEAQGRGGGGGGGFNGGGVGGAGFNGGGFRAGGFQARPIANGNASAWGSNGYYGLNNRPGVGVAYRGVAPNAYGYGRIGYLNGYGARIAALNGNGYGARIAAANGNGSYYGYGGAWGQNGYYGVGRTGYAPLGRGFGRFAYGGTAATAGMAATTTAACPESRTAASPPTAWPAGRTATSRSRRTTTTTATRAPAASGPATDRPVAARPLRDSPRGPTIPATKRPTRAGSTMDVPMTGVSAVNARGELALFIAPLAPASVPTEVRQAWNRLAVHSRGIPVSVRGYSGRAADAARRAMRRGETVLVVEVDEARQETVRVTPVPVTAE